MIAKEPNGVIAVVASGGPTLAAVSALHDAGIAEHSIVVVRQGETTDHTLPELDRGLRRALELATYWGGWGAVLAGALGIAVVAIPAIAAVVGLGSFSPELLAVPVVLALVGGLGAAATGVAIHVARALAYARALGRGKSVVVAHTDDDDALAMAKGDLTRLGAERVDVRRSSRTSLV